MNMKTILYEAGGYWITLAPKKGYEVYRNGLVASTRVAIIGYDGSDGLKRAIAEIDRRIELEQK